MSMTYKSLAAVRDLQDILSKWEAASFTSIVLGTDTNGDPTLTFSDGSPAAGEKVIVVRVRPLPANPTLGDALGNTAIQYSHHVIQFCTEANYASTTDNVADILGPAELLPLICEFARRDMWVEWYVSANGTAPATAQMTAANLKCQWHNIYGGTQSQS